MENFLGEMNIKNRWHRTIRTLSEELDIGMESTVKTVKYVTNKYGNKLDITVNFKGKTVAIFTPK